MAKRKLQSPKIVMLFLIGALFLSISSACAETAQEAFEIASSYLQHADLDKAIFYFSRVIQYDPKFSKAYNNRGIAYEAKGFYEQAISDYNKAIELDPQYAQAYNNRAVSYYFEKRYDKAMEDVRKAQELGFQTKPDFIEAIKKASETNQ